MSWQKHFSEKIADVLRVCPRAAMLVNAILISGGSVYIVFKVVRWSIHWLNARVFNGWWD